MKTSAQAIDEPRRGSSLVFSMMMILSAMSAGISGMPLVNATGNGEWVKVDMEKGHWESGEDVTATVKAESLGSGDYVIWYNVETINGTSTTNGTMNVSDTDGDGVEEFTVSISANDLWDDCWNIYADLLDSSGSTIAGSSFTFDVGTGMCPGNPSSGPHVWWNGSYWWSTDESVFYTAEIGNLDETKSYTLDWALREAGNSMDLMNGSEDLSGMGSSPTVDVYIGMLGDGCYEISGELSEGDGKQLQGGQAMYMFEVGNATCGGPSMINAYVMFYDGVLSVMAYGFEENQEDLKITVALEEDEDFGMEVYNMSMEFSADEYGMFEHEDSSVELAEGYYIGHVKIIDLSDDSVLYESWDVSLEVYAPGPTYGASAYTDAMNYQSGDDVYVDYWSWGTEAEVEVWECQVHVFESALNGNTSLENVWMMIYSEDVEPDWCGDIVDKDSILVGETGFDMFNGETVWVADEGLHGNLAYDGDLNMTMNLLNFSEFAEGEEEDWYYWCEETTAEDAEEGQYRCTDDYGHGNQPDGQDVYFWDYYDDCSYDADRTNEDGEAGLYWCTVENDDDEEWSIQDTCEMWFQGTYDEIEDTCSSVREFKTFDVGIEYIYEEYEIESHEYGEVTFVCGNGDEIDFSWVNDGYEDCEDGSDEPQDFDGDGVTDNWFDCNDGSTISMDLVNDGNADCSEGEDEGGDGEWTVSTEIESSYVRYYSDDSYVFIGDMSTEYISMYDVVISIYDEGGNFVDMAYGDDDETTIVFSGLADGKYAAFVSIVDSNGTTVFSSQHGSNFCIGECGHGGNWQTGDASLEFSYDWDDYVEEDCWGTVMLWEESTFLSMGMGGSGDDDHDDHDHGDHDGDHGDHDGDHGDHDGDHGDHDGDHGDHDGDHGDHDGDHGDHDGDHGDHQGDDDHGDHDGGHGDHHGNDDHDNNQPSPVWAASIGGPGTHSYDGLPEGEFVVMLAVHCKDDDGNEWEGSHHSSDTSTFTNGSTTLHYFGLETRYHDGHGDEGDDMEIEPSHMEFWIRIVDDSAGTPTLHLTTVAHITDAYRGFIDLEMGDGDGMVSETEASNFLAMIEMMESDNQWVCYDMENHDVEWYLETQEDCEDAGFMWVEMGDDDGHGDHDGEDDHGDHDDHDHGDHDDRGDDDGPDIPDFTWNGVALTEADLISETMEMSGLVGPVPSDASEDTYSVRMTQVAVLRLVDNGDAIQILSPFDDPHDEDRGDHGDNQWVCYDMENHDIEWHLETQEDCEDAGFMWVEMGDDDGHGDHDGDHGDHDGDHGDHDGDHGDHDGDHGDHDGDHGDHDGDHGDHGDHDGDHGDHDGDHGDHDDHDHGDHDGGHGDHNGDDRPCHTSEIYVVSSDDWEVVAVELPGMTFVYDATLDAYHLEFDCGEEPPAEGNMSFSRVADEPEPVVNHPPYCDVYYYGEASELADFQSTDDKADGNGETGEWEISIVEDDTYWLMFYCMDDEGDSITVNITSAFGNYGETFAAGSTEGYYELDIPTGSSVLSPYTLEYTWTDGTNSGSGVVTVNVAPSDGGTDENGEETEGEDTSAGSFVPGFTAVLTMTALAGALLVFSRRED